jgi:uncharacterized membrane protein YfcA
MSISISYTSTTASRIIFSVLELFAFIIGVFGNLILISVLCRDKKLRTKSNLYMILLAFADLLVTLIGIPSGVLIVSFLITFNQFNKFVELLSNCFVIQKKLFAGCDW